MKTSTMLFLGGVGAIAYLMYKKQNPLTAATAGASTVAVPVPVAVPVVTVPVPAAPAPLVLPNPPVALASPAVATIATVVAPAMPADAISDPPTDDFSDIVPTNNYSWTGSPLGARTCCGAGRHGHGHGGRH